MKQTFFWACGGVYSSRECDRIGVNRAGEVLPVVTLVGGMNQLSTWSGRRSREPEIKSGALSVSIPATSVLSPWKHPKTGTHVDWEFDMIDVEQSVLIKAF